MFGSPIVETAIGVLFIFLLLSLVNSALSEFFASLARLRAKNLAEGIRNLLNDDSGTDMAKAVMSHPLIASLTQKRGKTGKLPSYIPRETFSRALVDVLQGANTARDAAARVPKVDDLRDTVAGLKNAELKRTLLLFLDDSERSVKKFTADVEKWFDSSMDRVSGWYKRRAQLVALGSAVLITALANVDTISITKALYGNPTLRAGLADAATAFVADTANINAIDRLRATPAPTPPEGEEAVTPQARPDSAALVALQNILDRSTELQETELPLGWTAGAWPKDWRAWLAKVLGLLFTAFAAALGAPFWFDVLNKIVNLRGSGKKLSTG